MDFVNCSEEFDDDDVDEVDESSSLSEKSNCLVNCSKSTGVTLFDAVKRFKRSLANSSTPIMNASFRFSLKFRSIIIIEFNYQHNIKKLYSYFQPKKKI